LITELELLKKRLKALKLTFDDEDFVMQIINNLPTRYDSFIEAIEKDMNKELPDQITVKSCQRESKS
jgi:CRISPR/Cas system endoribonuclease Cas6 (RAMP superfamily)